MKLAGAYIAGFAVMLAGCGTNSKQEAEHELNRAVSALKQGSPQAAISHLDVSLANEPSAQAYQLRAEAQLDPGRFQRALDDAEAGLKLDPNNDQLRQVRNVAAACLKLVQGEASIVENSRYHSYQPHVARIDPLFDQQPEPRDSLDDEPFWKKQKRATEATYFPGLIDMNDLLWKQGMP